MSLAKNPVCPFEKQEVVCKICEGTDGAMESIFCEPNDHRLLNKIFKSTNVKPRCQEYVVEKIKFTAPAYDPFNCLDPCEPDIDVKEECLAEKLKETDEPFVKEVEIPLNCEDTDEEADKTLKHGVETQMKVEIVGDPEMSKDDDDDDDDNEFHQDSDRETHEDGDYTPNVEHSQKRKRGRPKLVLPNEGKAPTKCTICDKLVLYMKEHMQTHAKDKRLKCPHCDRTFAQSNNLTYHIRKHTGEKPFPCDKCDKSFICKSHLISHARYHENDQPYQCEVCSKRFNQACNLTKHLRVHSGEKPYSCKLCGKAFMNLSNMKVHEKRHQGDQSFTCEVCSKSFYDKYHLERHMMVHTKKKRYKCVRCPKQFDTVEDLKSHATHHKDSEEFISCEHCSKPFNTIHKLNLHMRSHMVIEVDSLKCDICSKQFKRRDHLESHRDKEHGGREKPTKTPREVIIDPETAKAQLAGPFQKPYQCEVCFKIFNQAFNLKVHLKTHIPDDKLLGCDKCPRQFRRRDHLEAHQRKGECLPETTATTAVMTVDTNDEMEEKSDLDSMIDLCPEKVPPDTHQIVLAFEVQRV
ncbi:hypothetical protein RP20_CCG008817 [Aedes albopictus]|nr:hypothetical protein RP20_CCG008817 [Aedes albopictus]